MTLRHQRAQTRTSRHEQRERDRRERRAREQREGDDRFAIYRVNEADLPPSRIAHRRTDAITHARGVAIGAGFRVVDVVRADWQENGDWLVELAVESAA